MRAKVDKKLVDIKKAIDRLVKARATGGAVAVSKWAESIGYCLKKKSEIEERAEFCKNYTGDDAWFGISKEGSRPHQKELDYIYKYRYGNKI